jgi:uncharacterized membrane protein YkvA (DUF1232 family)
MPNMRSGRDEVQTRDLVFALPEILKLLWKVVRDRRVPMMVRGGLIAIAGYLALPFDIIPDGIPVLGQVDDVVLITVGVRTVLRRVPEAIIREHWSGEDRILEAVLGRSLRDPLGNGSPSV